MILRHKFVALSALILLSGGAIANAQQPAAPPVAPRAEARAYSLILGGSYLGVQTENITGENAAKYNLREPRGVAVVKVMENSPAAKAGLREGDVILRFEGEEVKSAAKLTRLIAEVAPDQKARVTILRGGDEQDLTVTIGKREAPEFQAFGNLPNGDFRVMTPQEFRNLPELRNLPDLKNLPELPRVPEAFEMYRAPRGEGDNFMLYFNNGRRIGVVATPLTKQLGEYFGAADGKGLLIEEVRENSPAAKAGLRAGDIILDVDGEAVSRQGDLVRILNKKAEGDVTLNILRDKQRQSFRVTPEGKVQTPAAPATPAAPGTKFRI